MSWEQLDYENGKIRNLHYGLIHKGLPTMVDLSKETLPFVKGEAPRNYTICKDGDVAFADASEDTNDVAKAIEFINCNNEDVICGLHSIHGRDKTKSTIVGYKGYAFASFAFHKQIRRITQGTKIYSISTKNFNETYVGVPSIEEQTKIARLLFLIDERISTQNKIIDKLESLIKGLCEQLLNTNRGNMVTISEILSERSERTTYNNQHEVLSSTVKGIYSQRDYFSKDIASENNVGYKIIHLNDIVLSPQNLWMGNINYNDKFEKGIVSPSYKVYAISNSFDNIYIAYLLKTHRALYTYMLASEQGASIVRRNLNIELFSQLNFRIPSLHEQIKIGNMILSIKRKLENELLQLNNLKLQKDYLLQQMFI